MISKEELEKKLKESFPAAQIKLQDLTGGQDHWHLEITCPTFSGKTLIEQHQMVYQALGSWMKKEIHALSLTTKS